jgi:hypothetical protein
MENKTDLVGAPRKAVYLKYNFLIANSIKSINFWLRVFLELAYYPIFIVCDLDEDT